MFAEDKPATMTVEEYRTFERASEIFQHGGAYPSGDALQANRRSGRAPRMMPAASSHLGYGPGAAQGVSRYNQSKRDEVEGG
jgi:hypothetical protein